MGKIIVFAGLFLCYIAYSAAVYTKGTVDTIGDRSSAQQLQIEKGKSLFQENNCISCHQLYGLGGYLGPELTTAWSDKQKGPAYMRAMLTAGGSRMPDFNFTEEQVSDILRFLQYVDSTAITYKSSQP